MKITKNWFFDISNLDDLNIDIDDNLDVWIFDSNIKKRKVNIWENSKVYYFSFVYKKWEYLLEFSQNASNSNLNASILLFSKNSESINIWLISNVNDSNCSSFVNIVSLVWDDGIIKVDWVIMIKNDVENLECFLDEKNIFLSSTWKIYAKPELLINSNNLKAWHSCNIERLNYYDLFYLNSRGIDWLSSINLILKWKIEKLFHRLKDYNKSFFEKLLDKIENKILKKT